MSDGDDYDLVVYLPIYIVIHWNLIITWATCAFIAAVLNTCGPQTFVICGHLPGGDPRAKTDIFVYFILFELNLEIEMTNRQNLIICIFFAYAYGKIFQI